MKLSGLGALHSAHGSGALRMPVSFDLLVLGRCAVRSTEPKRESQPTAHAYAATVDTLFCTPRAGNYYQSSREKKPKKKPKSVQNIKSGT